jgi:hypothetical protein
MNDRFFRRTAVPDFTLTQHFSRCERAQQEFDTSGVGSLLPFAAFAQQKKLADALSVRFIRAALSI